MALVELLPSRQTYKVKFRHKRIRLMDLTIVSAITSRAHWLLKEHNTGYSRGDVHRKHIKKRFEMLASIGMIKGSLLPCDKCGRPIEINTYFFIHQRKSFNKYYHEDCAKRMNMY
jgi:hypothetical protein